MALMHALEGRLFFAAGALDPTFGQNGVITSHFRERDRVDTEGCTVDAQGRLVVFGTRSGNSTYGKQLIVSRFDRHGILDRAFGVNAHAQSFDDMEHENSLAVGPDGAVFIGGNFLNDTNDRIELIGFNSDGSVNQSFGQHGRVLGTIDTADGADQILVQSDGKVLVASADPSFDATGGSLILSRFNANGSSDSGFASNGVLRLDIHDATIALQADGKILAAGSVGHSLVAARFNANGSPDSSFAVAGRATVSAQTTTPRSSPSGPTGGS